ncbi:MAG: transcriptional activator RfaH [Thermodesulfobacteriota bacterium]|nr:transcriptional activator RfaH [Thermodesulfobacteriota bacterium]
MDKEWFVIRTKSRQENLAKEHYSRQGFSVYLPVIKKTVRHARRVSNTVRPFFPGYLFLHLAPNERDWTAISSTIGSIGPVHFGDNYPPVPTSIISNLKTLEDDKGHIANLMEYSRLQKGAKIRIMHGELEGLDGIYVELRGEDRAMILLDFLQRRVTATVPLTSIEAG